MSTYYTKMSLQNPTALQKYPGMRQLTMADVPKAAQTLYASFRTDALAGLLTEHIRGDHERQEVETELYECYLRQHILKGVCFGVNEDPDLFETVAIFATPTSEAEGLYSFENMMESGFGHLYDRLSEHGRTKIFKGLLPLLHDSCERILNQPRFATKKCWTLVYVGSLARSRGKGNLRKLFTYMFDNFIDAEPDTICYLESSSPANIPIYERFDFWMVEDIVLGNKFDGAVEGKDYAIMNVMIRGTQGRDWRKETKL
ncbi:hypothetical protein DICA3_F35850 [Diutina catenulata]